MADITRRAARRMADHLGEGEPVRAALLVEPSGSYGLGAFWTAAAPRAGARRLAERAAQERVRQGGLAARFPTGPGIVVVTDRRLLVAPSNGLRFGDPVIELPPGGIRIADVRRRGLARRLVLLLADGTSLTADAQPLQRLRRFEEALTAAT
jgi:hypothetical protein